MESNLKAAFKKSEWRRPAVFFRERGSVKINSQRRLSEVPLPHNKTQPATQEIFTTAFRVMCAGVENKAGEVENFR